MTYYDIWHMTFAQQNMALWVSKVPSCPVKWIYGLKSICPLYNFLNKLQKSDFGIFPLYFEGNSFVKCRCNSDKNRRSQKLGNTFFM